MCGSGSEDVTNTIHMVDATQPVLYKPQIYLHKHVNHVEAVDFNRRHYSVG